ncbi:GNAT family N-acetyltransferase [Lactobacillaceae bacterium L1_55_11]|nr:GNAT family N-acetyltransferase [Lactobacillaceae bacterium L1_55_11]
MQVKSFNELSPEELYQILRLRAEVFIVEQGQPYQDIDNKDQDSLHVFEIKDGQAIAYTRIYEIEDGRVSFGRVVTAKDARGHGLGRRLMDTVMETIAQHYPGKEIMINAQKPVVGLYEKFGFKSQSKPFLLEGRRHVVMTFGPKN